MAARKMTADGTLRAQLASVLEGGGRVAPDNIDELVELADELTGLTLDGIRRRPAQLHSMQSGLEAQLLGLASGPGCTSFVESAKCAADVRAGLRVMLDRAAALGAVLPAVGVASDALFREARYGASERSRLALVLEQHDALVEILEQPQLMSSCVRNGLFDEVLELDAAASARAAMHPELPALVSVAAGVRASLGAMRERLLSKLAAQLTLPEALHTVGLLRRLPPPHALSEAHLRAVFLRNRSLHLQRARSALPDASEEPVDHVLRYLELCRVHWYDDIVQYRAIFSAGAPPCSSDADAAAERILRGPAHAAQPAPTEQVSVRLPAGAGEYVALASSDGAPCLLKLPAGAGEWSGALAAASWGDGAAELAPSELVHADRLSCAMLGAWAGAAAEEMVRAVSFALGRVHEGAYLASVAEHAAYSAASLGRVGLDASALLHAPLRTAALRIFSASLRAAADHWKRALGALHWAAPPASAAAIAALSASGAPAAASAAEAAAALSPSTPPMCLLRFVPLAVLCNHAMASFNQLRPTAAHELRDDVARALAAALVECATALRDCAAQAGASGEHGSTHHQMMSGSFREDLVPHLARCLDALLPQWAPPDALGTRSAVPMAGDGWGVRIVKRVRDVLVPVPGPSDPLAGWAADSASNPEPQEVDPFVAWALEVAAQIGTAQAGGGAPTIAPPPPMPGQLVGGAAGRA